MYCMCVRAHTYMCACLGAQEDMKGGQDRFNDLLGQLPDDFGDDILLTMFITCFVILAFFFLGTFLMGIGARLDYPHLK